MFAGVTRAQEAPTNSPPQIFAKALTQLVGIIQPPTNRAPQIFSTTLKVLKAEGFKGIEGRELELAFQAPDRLRLSAKWDERQ